MFRKVFSSVLLIAAFTLLLAATNAEARGYRGGYRNRGGILGIGFGSYGNSGFGNSGYGNYGYGNYSRGRMNHGASSACCNAQPADCCGQPGADSTVSSPPVAPQPAMQRAPSPAAAN